ncbi:MAG TPA: Na/Pi cotransporter family protein [Dongiaceae bacterium]
MEASINGTTFLLNLLGAAALLLWGLRMVRTGVLRAYGGELRRRLGHSMGNRFSALLGGLGITLLLQSSTATAMMAASFASRGLVSAAAALAIMLGADIGTSLVAQVYSFQIPALSPLLILVGVALFMTSQATRRRDLGRAVIGLGLVLLALQMIAANGVPMRESPILADIVIALKDAPVMAVVVAALLTMMSTSSLAVVLLVIAFVQHDLMSLPLAFALILGANLGSAGLPLLATARSEPEARRVPLGNLIFRLAGVAILLPLLPLVTPHVGWIEAEPWRQVANFHTGFNLALAAVFLPLIGPVAKLCARILPERPQTDSAVRPRHLDRGALESPAVAIANAARETLRMGDIIEKMLIQTLDVFRHDDRKLLHEVEELDNGLDTLNEAIKLYLTEVSRETLAAEDGRRAVDIITFTTNLEHVGDIIDKNLMELASKKIRNKLQFSTDGFQEICDMHSRLVENLKLALNVFISGDVRMARRLLEEKVAFRELERFASESHLKRLRRGTPESLETSSLHLDVIRDLKRINSHLTSVAYPILDAAGELAATRLKPAEEQRPA